MRISLYMTCDANNANIKNAERLLEFNIAINSAINHLIIPLNNNFSIDHLVYAQFCNNTLFKISNNLEWIKFIIDHKCYELDFYQKHINNLLYQSTYKVLWDYEYNPVMLNALQHHNLKHALTIYIRYNGYVDMWSFATTKTAVNIISLYLNNVDYLKRFALYFKNKINELINAKEINLDNFLLHRTKLLPLNNNAFAFENAPKAFFEQTRIKVFYFEKLRVNLAPREIDCLHYISLGQSIKEVAIALNISPRTVEDYLSNLKNKLGYSCKRQLLDFYYRELKDYCETERGIDKILSNK